MDPMGPRKPQAFIRNDVGNTFPRNVTSTSNSKASGKYEEEEENTKIRSEQAQQ